MSPKSDSGRPAGNRPENSPESMDKPDKLSGRKTHEAGEQKEQKRTAGNHPADPNRMGAKWNLLPPGISDDDAADPGGMKEKKGK